MYSDHEHHRALNHLARDIEAHEPFCEMTGPMPERPADPTTGLPTKPIETMGPIEKMATFVAERVHTREGSDALHVASILCEHRQGEIALQDGTGDQLDALVRKVQDNESYMFAQALRFAAQMVRIRLCDAAKGGQP